MKRRGMSFCVSQLILIFFIDFTAFLVIYLKTFDYKVVRFYIEMQIFFAVIQILYRVLYKKASLLLLNNMCMLLSVGFIMLCRLDITMATKQLLVAAGASAVALAIPVMIRKMRFLRKLTWIYAGIGVVLPGAVFLLARTSLWSEVDTFGCAAIRGDQDYLCIHLWHHFCPEIPVLKLWYRYRQLQLSMWGYWCFPGTLEVP